MAGSSNLGGNVFSSVWAGNVYSEDAVGDRVSVDLLAPATLIDVVHLGGAVDDVGPEGALDGYVANQINAGVFPAERMNEVAVSIDHPVIHRFQQLARELDMCLAFGFPQPLEEDGSYVMKAVAGRKGDERDRVEKEFLKWRENAMKVRLEKTRKRLRDD